MTAKLLPLLPRHEQYDEPFFGGGSVFSRKHPAPTRQSTMPTRP